jgi:proteasome-associated ATPase
MPRRLRRDGDDPEVLAVLERLGGDLSMLPPLTEQLGLVARARERSAASGQVIDEWFLCELADLRRVLRDVQGRQNELKKLHERLTSPPWFTGVFLRGLGGSPPRAAVTYQNTPRIVTLGEAVSLDDLAVGDDVLLSHDLNLLLEKLTPGVKRMCEVADFQHQLGDRLVLKTRDAEVVVHAAGTLDVDALTPGDRVLWDPSLAMAFERLPRPAESGLFLTETPTQRFSDIGGLDVQIAKLRRAVGLHAQHPDLVARYGLARAASVLLVGPPGTGKTMLARALAQWLGESSPGGSRFLYIKPGALHSMWWGQSEANYREVFRVAREVGAANPGMPVVMFFDEVDSIGVTRSSDAVHHVAGRVLESFMTELDGLQGRGNILVVAATNRRDAIDPALLRPGRLGDLVLEVPRPNMVAARAILDRHFPASAPYESSGDADAARRDVIDTAISRLYAPNGLGDAAALTFRDGSRRAVQARDLVSGAMLANIARASVEQACVRELETGEAGIRRDDVLDAIGDAVAAAVAALAPHNCYTHIDGLPQDLMVVRIDAVLRRPRRPQRFRIVA